MSTFIVTPTNYELITDLVRDPVSGLWVMPVLEFNPRVVNPYYGEIDLMNEDPNYQNRVIEYFYTKLTEKWLTNSSEFRKLLKYFKVEKTDDKGTVSLIDDVDKAKDTTKDDLDKRYIFRYIKKRSGYKPERFFMVNFEISLIFYLVVAFDIYSIQEDAMRNISFALMYSNKPISKNQVAK